MNALSSNRLTLSVVAFSLFLAACEKEALCPGYTELTEQDHQVDLTPLDPYPAFKDTLAKYPQLQVYRVIEDQYTVGMHCKVFYQKLPVFSDGYALFIHKSDNVPFSFDKDILDTVIFSLTPAIQFDEAIAIAKKAMNYGNTCISYRLGIFNLNAGLGTTVKEYKLVWKVEGEHGFPYVVLDANNGQVYRQDDGVRN